MNILPYNEVDFSRLVCSDAEKIEYTNKETQEKGFYHSIGAQYDLGERTVPLVFRLPPVCFYAITEKSNALAMIHNVAYPENAQILEFFTKMNEKGCEFIHKNARRLGKGNITSPQMAAGILKPPIYQKIDENTGKPKNAGASYFKFINGGVSRDSSLFIGPGKDSHGKLIPKVYPRKTFLNCSLEGSPIVRFDSIYCGQACSFRLSLVQIDILKVTRVNSKSNDPEYMMKYFDQAGTGFADEFFQTLAEGPDDTGDDGSFSQSLGQQTSTETTATAPTSIQDFMSNGSDALASFGMPGKLAPLPGMGQPILPSPAPNHLASFGLASQTPRGTPQ
nr:hypothetical protein pmam_98 [Pithovirus mammoth]